LNADGRIASIDSPLKQLGSGHQAPTKRRKHTPVA